MCNASLSALWDRLGCPVREEVVIVQEEDLDLQEQDMDDDADEPPVLDSLPEIEEVRPRCFAWSAIQCFVPWGTASQPAHCMLVQAYIASAGHCLMRLSLSPTQHRLLWHGRCSRGQ